MGTRLSDHRHVDGNGEGTRAHGDPTRVVSFAPTDTFPRAKETWLTWPINFSNTKSFPPNFRQGRPILTIMAN